MIQICPKIYTQKVMEMCINEGVITERSRGCHLKLLAIYCHHGVSQCACHIVLHMQSHMSANLE